jgi:DNA modification methylase
LYKTTLADYLVKDYTKIYEEVMQFNKNKTAFIHQWYPFVEGYSKEFIESIVSELGYVPENALDPFAGSGTTPIELQNLDIKCHSFEVSPFMHLLATVKLETEYTTSDFTDALITVGSALDKTEEDIRYLIHPPLAQTFQKKDGLKKWVFNKTVMDGILDIKYAISKLEDKKYQNVFKMALASILLEVSNVYRNGKCVSYKKKWKSTRTRRKAVHQKFINRLVNIIHPDIERIERNEYLVNNKDLCIYGDVRKNIKCIPNNTIDLVITSPPYLNSRDYTDIYMVELWMLDLVESYESIRELRKSTLRSHVQIKHGAIDILEIEELQDCLRKISGKKELWNEEIPNMIKGYFVDMNTLFEELQKKMRKGKKIFFNVANSAYYGVEVKVDEIVCKIAERHGFIINEIREARQLNPSSQQKEQIKSLRESVIVMTS